MYCQFHLKHLNYCFRVRFGLPMNHFITLNREVGGLLNRQDKGDQEVTEHEREIERELSMMAILKP